MHSVSVSGVAHGPDGRILCIRRRDNGAWQIPGGVLERGETLHEGLRREVREETGCLVEPERLTGIYLNLPVGVVALVFLCRATSDRLLEQTAEATAVRWLTVDEIVRRSVPAFAVRVTDAVAGRPEPFLRHHDGVRLIDGGAGTGPGRASAEDPADGPTKGPAEGPVDGSVDGPTEGPSRPPFTDETRGPSRRVMDETRGPKRSVTDETRGLPRARSEDLQRRT